MRSAAQGEIDELERSLGADKLEHNEPPGD
jgi:hypothetical protein